MNYKLNFEHRSSYLYVNVEIFKANYEVYRESCKKIAEKAGESPKKQVLIETASEEQLSTVKAFQLAAELPSLGFGNLKIALVDTSEANVAINKFTETVAINRGINIKAFTDVDAAERWLLST